MSPLTAISPVDGRYASKCESLRSIFSELGLIRRRVQVEIAWLIFLLRDSGLEQLPSITPEQVSILEDISLKFSEEDGAAVKRYEKVTNHDVKAVEYFIKEKMSNDVDLSRLVEWIHFCCTSEDINNISHALMMKEYSENVLRPRLKGLVDILQSVSVEAASCPLLALTHGQAASPTTFGKEMRIFYERLKRQLNILEHTDFFAKFNGASGNFNAHVFAYPQDDWQNLAKIFIEKFNLSYQPFSTQIESHDYISEFCDAIARTNTILIDLCRDIWLYVSRGVLKLKVIESEIGSSTMPHKINPIDFENAEGNFGVANALLTHFSQKLPISRLQRDLTDSTVLRSFGVAAAHTLIAHDSLAKGLQKITTNVDKCHDELEANWSVLTEAIQTVLRKHSVKDAYERIKEATRGKMFGKIEYFNLIASVKSEIGDKDYKRLETISPATYLGLASDLAGLPE